MNRPLSYSFQRYLLSKRDLDSRSLNHTVLEKLVQFCSEAGRLRTLELGAGVGTMLERLAEMLVLAKGEYLGLDSDEVSTAFGLQRVPEWAVRQGFSVHHRLDSIDLAHPSSGDKLRIDFRTADALEFCQGSENVQAWDLLVAHAFLDLFDLPAALPVFLQALRPGGAFYFTMNFDGETIFEPQIDDGLDKHIISLYHRSMDDRKINGMPSGDSRSGRHLFTLLPQAGGTIQAAGSSDWVVFPGPGGYPGDEAYFLHHILYFFEQSLSNHSELDDHRFTTWLDRRHAQVERGELVYIAHQMDFFGLMGRG